MPCPTPLFHVRTSEIHGVGLFAMLLLPANTRLGTYEGRRMSPAEVEATDWESHLTYLFGLSDGTAIDGAQGGNELRHLNHSCSPNCEAVETWAPDGTLRLDIVTLCDVLAGEELCIDYALAIDTTHAPEAYPCACSSVECRGTMAASA
ncbi:SET domain-containing protein [Variovorax sp. LjRoot84]|uniref:SET domain-containing protein n=1 Tax=Variovorax sp. LjRoot84 TaxID=3342340 RepID=UPI003F50D75B